MPNYSTSNLIPTEGFWAHIFSALSPGAHIEPHRGPTNRKLRIYLRLIIPDGKKNSITGRRRNPNT